MHEMSIAESLLNMAIAEAQKQGCDTLLRVCVEYGVLSGIMPEALSFCFETLVQNGPHEQAQLELKAIPARLRCPLCNAEFECGSRDALYQPCPECGEAYGYNLSEGHELVLAQIEACKKNL